MSLHRALLLAGLTVSALALRSAGAFAATPPYPVVYSFGDSLSDVGNGFIDSGRTTPVVPPYAVGHWSNGPVWLEDFAKSLGEPPVRPSHVGGSDFAIAGACTGTTSAHQENTTDLPTQLADFIIEVPQPVAGALYTLDIGDNDIGAIIDVPGITMPEAQADVEQAVENVTLFIQNLVGAGMQNLLLLTAPDQRNQPGYSGGTPEQNAMLSRLDTQFNAGVASAATALAAQHGFKLTILSLYSLIDEIVADPANYGFTNATEPCYTGSPFEYDGTLCASTRRGQDVYLFWDSIHPTEAGHAQIGAAATAALTATAAAMPQDALDRSDAH